MQDVVCFRLSSFSTPGAKVKVTQGEKQMATCRGRRQL